MKSAHSAEYLLMLFGDDFRIRILELLCHHEQNEVYTIGTSKACIESGLLAQFLTETKIFREI